MGISKKEFSKLIQNVSNQQTLELDSNVINQMDARNKAIYLRLVSLVEKGIALYIPYNIPALKNSKEIFTIFTGKSACCKAPYIKLGKGKYKCTKCNNMTTLGTRPIITKSKPVKEYYNNSADIVLKFANNFLHQAKNVSLPYHIGFYFIRGTHKDFDLDNAITTILDQLKSLGYYSDDNSKYVYPYPLGEHYEKNNGGAIVALMEIPTFQFINDPYLPL